MGKSMKVIPFRKIPKEGDVKEGNVMESGTIGDKPYELEWELYTYGTIHIFQGDLRFKKDCDKFADELEKVPLNLKPGEKHVIKASGDNDDLVIEADQQGNYILILTRKGIGVIEKLKGLVSKAKSYKKK